MKQTSWQIPYQGLEAFEKELFEDDQTGQISNRASRLGESMKNLEENYVAGRMRGIAFTIAGESYPASTFATTNAAGTAITVPFSANMYTTGSGNRLGTYAQLSYTGFKTALEVMLNALDPLGVVINVNPNTVVVSAFDFVNVRSFLNSAYYPAVPGRGGETVANAASGFAGGAFSENQLKGLLNSSLNRYLPQGAWYVGEAHKGMIFQRRAPLEVVQENPLSGESFSRDVYRFKSRARWESEWIDPRFWFQGNDGSASVTQ